MIKKLKSSMKKLFAKRVDWLATPPAWYGVACTVGLAFCVLAALFQRSNLLVGLGSGTIASLLVALLIDIGNTNRQRELDEASFNAIMRSLKDECGTLPWHVMIVAEKVAPWDKLSETDTWKMRLIYLLTPAKTEEGERIKLARITIRNKLLRTSQYAEDILSRFDLYAGRGFYSIERRDLLDIIRRKARWLCTFCQVPAALAEDEAPREVEKYCQLILRLFPDLKDEFERWGETSEKRS